MNNSVRALISLYCISRLSKAVSYYSLMSDVHLSVLRSLSSQASVVTDVVVAMGYLLPLYRTTFSSIQAVFLSFIEQAGRSDTIAPVCVCVCVCVCVEPALCMLFVCLHIIIDYMYIMHQS